MRAGGAPAVAHKLTLLANLIRQLPFVIIAVPVVVLMRLLRPWILIRIGGVNGARIGHFAANTDLYLCERDTGIDRTSRRLFDVLHFGGQTCNAQLLRMWGRVVRVWPSRVLEPVGRLNRLLPGSAVHEIGANSQGDRDVHNLWDQLPPHISWTPEEEQRGEGELRLLGIPAHAAFVCLVVRDNAYLQQQQADYDWSYHDYRDSDIANYVLAAEALAERGYYVVRMGAVVKAAMPTTHPRIIDYAVNGRRTDFMDVYLGAKCTFCISTGTGWDYIPGIFRRPVVYVNFLPLGELPTFRTTTLTLTKTHWLAHEQRRLTLTEIFDADVAVSLRSSDFESRGVTLLENSPEEIRDVVMEMADRLEGGWQPQAGDEERQHRFWALYEVALQRQHTRARHGELRAKFGADFLRNNTDWLR